jgi:hypothetical protein
MITHTRTIQTPAVPHELHTTFLDDNLGPVDHTVATQFRMVEYNAIGYPIGSSWGDLGRKT